MKKKITYLMLLGHGLASHLKHEGGVQCGTGTALVGIEELPSLPLYKITSSSLCAPFAPLGQPNKGGCKLFFSNFVFLVFIFQFSPCLNIFI
jgi:hypothetical protein